MIVWLIASLPRNRTPKITWNNKKRPWLYQMEKMTRPAKHSSAPTSFPWQFKYWLNFRKKKTLENNKRKDCMLPASTIYSSCSQRQGNGKSKINNACCMDELGSPALSLGNGADEAREAVGSGLSSQLEIPPIQCALGRGGVERWLQLSHPNCFQAFCSYFIYFYWALLSHDEPCVSFLWFTMYFRPIMGLPRWKIHESNEFHVWVPHFGPLDLAIADLGCGDPARPLGELKAPVVPEATVGAVTVLLGIVLGELGMVLGEPGMELVPGLALAALAWLAIVCTDLWLTWQDHQER